MTSMESGESGNVDGLRLVLPATSANLGPGFDAVGLALSLNLVLEAWPAQEFTIRATGRDVALTGALSNNLILMTYREVLGDLGRAVPPLALAIDNGIPLGMGCGSSAAAICAGVLLANHFGGLCWTDAQVLDEAALREGHPDNVAACLGGGLTVSRTLPGITSSAGRTVCASFGQHLPWRLLLALPVAGLSTAKARGMLPATYSRADAVLNVQATALLVSAFALGRPELLAAATEDRLHQPYRLAACPLFARLLPLAGIGGVYAVTLSGAGPTALIVVAREFATDRVRELAGDLLAELLEVSIAGGAQSAPASRSRKHILGRSGRVTFLRVT